MKKRDWIFITRQTKRQTFRKLAQLVGGAWIDTEEEGEQHTHSTKCGCPHLRCKDCQASTDTLTSDCQYFCFRGIKLISHQSSFINQADSVQAIFVSPSHITTM